MTRIKRYLAFFGIVFAVYILETLYVVGSLPELSSTNSLLDRFQSFPQSSQIPLVLPLQHVWNDYQKWHSHQALTREKKRQLDPDRKYQVVYYQCPHAAGNLLHDLFNQVIVFVTVACATFAAVASSAVAFSNTTTQVLFVCGKIAHDFGSDFFLLFLLLLLTRV